MILSGELIGRIRLRKLKIVFDISRNGDLITAAAYSLSQGPLVTLGYTAGYLPIGLEPVRLCTCNV